MAVTIPVLTCDDCGRQQLPPRYRCRFCHGPNLSDTRVSGHGAIYSYTVIRVPPARLAVAAPYTVVAVRLNDDVTLTGRITPDPAQQPGDGVGADGLVGRKARLHRQDDEGFWFVLSDDG